MNYNINNHQEVGKKDNENYNHASLTVEKANQFYLLDVVYPGKKELSYVLQKDHSSMSSSSVSSKFQYFSL